MATHILYDWAGFNVALFHAINDIKDPTLNVVMLLGTVLGDFSRIIVYGPVFAAIALTYAYRHYRRERLTDACLWLVALCTLAGAVVLDGLFLSLLKPLLDMPRPALALGMNAVKVVGELKLHNSFPSGHASFAMTMAASLWIVLPPFGRLLAGAFVAWVAVSRVYVGAHFPVDVVAGLLSSWLIVLLVCKVSIVVVPAVVRFVAGRQARAARLR